MNNDAYKICIVLKCCIFFVIGQVVVHATILHSSLFIVHWPCFIVHSFHNIVHPDVQHVVHSANCTIVLYFEQFVPTLAVRLWTRSGMLKKKSFSKKLLHRFRGHGRTSAGGGTSQNF